MLNKLKFNKLRKFKAKLRIKHQNLNTKKLK
jgi:hypothetical protein